MIVCDVNENRSIVPKQLEKMGVEIKWESMPVGDYRIDDLVVFERKEADDFISSMIEGRLNNQLYNMSTNYPHSAIIIEGSITEALMYRKLQRSQAIAAMAGAFIERSPDKEQGVVSMIGLETPFDTALFLMYCHKRAQEEDGLIRLPKLNPVKWKPEKRALPILASFPFVGKKRAEAILSHPKLNSIKKIVNANRLTLMQVNGIGPKIADKIIETIQKEYDQ